MLFNSLSFLAFTAVVFPLYYCLNWRWQNRLLLFASYLFYAAWDWRFVGLLSIATLVAYFLALRIWESEIPATRSRLLRLGICVNLGILCAFKYFDFFAAQFFSLLRWYFGLTFHDPVFNIVLPLGISFYTFQSISYLVDVYRQKFTPSRSIWDFALYISFFPQLVAGPIERPAALLPQITSARAVTVERIQAGGWLLLWGFYKKLFIADNIAPIVSELLASDRPLSVWMIVLLCYLISTQIYCDFSGYSDIARGLAKLLGIDLMINFQFPFFAQNPREFWHRWHISLSEWLRDYLYIPLGGNRDGITRQNRNVLLTMSLGGLWHGAAWHYLIWGIYHGTLLVVHRQFSPRVTLASPTSPARHWLPLANWFLMLNLTAFGFFIFRVPSLSEAWRILSATYLAPTLGGNELEILQVFLKYTALLWVVEYLAYRRGDITCPLHWKLPIRVILYLLLFYSIVWFGELGGRTFVYFQF